MLQASLYADHSRIAASADRSHSPAIERKARLRFPIRLRFRQKPNERMSDHLLHDIGMTRAEICALGF